MGKENYYQRQIGDIVSLLSVNRLSTYIGRYISNYIFD